MKCTCTITAKVTRSGEPLGEKTWTGVDFDFEKYAHRYLGEYQYRFNRRFDLAGMLSRLVIATALTDKRPEAWLRLAGDQC